MSKSLAEIIHNPARVGVFVALAIALAVLLLIARDSWADSQVGNFEIDATCPTTSCTEPVDPPTCPQGGVPCDASYYSSKFKTGDGIAGDDWVDGDGAGATRGVFKFSTAPPHTASDPDLTDATAVTCYGSGIDFDDPGGVARLLCDGYGKDFNGGSLEMNIVSPSGGIPDDQWPIKKGTLGAPKDGRTHGFFLQRSQSRTCSGVTSPHNIVIPAYERTNSEGEFHQGIELNAVPPRGLLTVANNADPGANFVLDFNRQVGAISI